MKKKIHVLGVLILVFFAISSSAQCYTDKIKVVVDGKEINTEAKMIDNKVYLPVRSVSEALGAQVEWDGADRTVSVSMSGNDELIPEVLKRVSPCVVGVVGNLKEDLELSSSKYTEQIVHGTGVIIKSVGEILTNAHVVKDMDKIVVVLSDGSGYEAKLKCIDEEADLAVVKINKTGLTAATFGKEEDIVIGKTVIAIGTPVSISLRNSASIGIISGINRGIGSPYRLIQTDAAINPGNSGGPLVNLKGEVIGINSSKFSAAGIEGLGFSIPLNTINYVLKQFVDYGKVRKPYLGANFEEDWAARVGLPTNSGLCISNMDKNSPAQNQGLKIDDIILSVNDDKVNTIVDFNEVMKKYFPGDSVTIKIKRDDVIQSISVKLDEKKGEKVMKKLVVLGVLIFCISIFAGISVYAETDSGEKVEISFKVGDETLKINSKDVTVEKPYVKNGVTLVPLRVITEAFGAEVTWNSNDKSIILKYGDVLIKLVVGSKEAVVDEKKSTLLEVPVIKNGVTMVPMRFITENFGADVGFDNKTQAITVLKEIANSNSIKDFGLLLKKTNKGKVGDSYYNWSLSLPKKLKISYRNFSGTDNRFSADDGTYNLSIYIEKLEDETLDSILSKEIDDAKDYTILDQGIGSINGQNYVKCIAKGEKFTYEDRIFVNNGKIYSLYLYVPVYNDYKNNKDLTALLDSFTLKFANDGNTEDLSDISSEGFRKYENKKLKWSISVQPDMEEYKNTDKENVVNFNDEDDNGLYVGMYSIEDGLTLDKWIEDELKDIKEDYNPEAMKVISSEESTLNDIRCKKLLISMTSNGKTKYIYDFYMFGENYRYEIGYVIKYEDYNNAESKKKFEFMINSFKFSEPDEDEVGQLIDPDKIALSDSVRKVENKDYKWSYELPVSWTAQEGNTGTAIMYSDKKKYVNLTMLVIKGATLEGYASSFEEKIQEQVKLSNNVTFNKNKDISDKGTSIKNYLITTSNENSTVKEITYLLSKNGNVYLIIFTVNELNWSEKNLKTVDTIWQSAKFE